MKGNRILGLDALRGIAAILVLIQHVFHRLADSGNIAFAFAREDLDLGRMGVTAFFLISGYVIPANIVSVRQFAVTRFCRVMPPYWASPLFALVVFGAMGQGFSAYSILSNFYMVGMLTGDKINGVYWTLTIEAIFYIMVAALFATGQLRNRLVLAGVALACVAMGEYKWWIAQFAVLLIGALWHLGKSDKDARYWTFAVALVFLYATSDYTKLHTWLGALGGAAIFFAALRLKSPPRWLLGAGAISYSLYLIHVPILEALKPLIDNPALYMAIGAGLSVAVASLLWLVVERPAIAWARAVYRSPTMVNGGTNTPRFPYLFRTPGKPSS